MAFPGIFGYGDVCHKKGPNLIAFKTHNNFIIIKYIIIA
jgi:hypothetical protein